MALFTDSASNDAATLAAGGGLGVIGAISAVLSAELKAKHAVPVLMFAIALSPLTTWVVLRSYPGSDATAVVAGFAAGFAALWALPTFRKLAELAMLLLGKKGEKALKNMIGDKDDNAQPPATG